MASTEHSRYDRSILGKEGEVDGAEQHMPKQPAACLPCARREPAEDAVVVGSSKKRRRREERQMPKRARKLRGKKGQRSAGCVTVAARCGRVGGESSSGFRRLSRTGEEEGGGVGDDDWQLWPPSQHSRTCLRACRVQRSAGCVMVAARCGRVGGGLRRPTTTFPTSQLQQPDCGIHVETTTATLLLAGSGCKLRRPAEDITDDKGEL